MAATTRRGAIERALQSIPPHAKPDPRLEQVQTPAGLAADVLFEAHALRDLSGRVVFDLGCGTGTLAIGAALLGAMPVMGFDIDEDAVEVAKAEAQRLGASQCEFEVTDIADVDGGADLVLSNPPFGAQKRHADRPFIDAAARCAPVAYTFHMATTRDWVETRILDLGGAVTHAWPYRFPLRAQHHFHDKPVRDVDVVVLRWTTGLNA